MRRFRSSPENALRILQSLSESLADDTGSWQSIVCAARNCGVESATICDWSRTARYGDRNQVMRAIKNLRSKAGFGTLVHYARRSGVNLDSLSLEDDSEQIRKTHVARFSTPEVGPNVRISDGKRTLDAIISSSPECGDEAELWERSPCRIDWPVQQDAAQLLRFLYHPDDRLFIGRRYDSGPGHVKPTRLWIGDIEKVACEEKPELELIQPNPHSGRIGRTKDGKPSWRCDGCVSDFRFAVVEFDDIGETEQLAFWIAMIDAGWPVAVVIHSGGRSLHGWVSVNCIDRLEWDREVEDRLFGGYLKPLGVDGACRNESRLSRLPGHYRRDKNTWQRLLYINPYGLVGKDA